MCNQTVGLIAAEIERRGMATVCIVFRRDIAAKVRPPRALCVPYPHGYALGQPNDPPLQRRIIMAALKLLERDDVPVLEDLERLSP